MSGSQGTFDAIRKAAYAFANQRGKDAEGLRRACEAALQQRRREIGSEGVSEDEDKRIINDVVSWTMRRYNPPKWKPERNREERAAAFLMTPAAFEMAGEQFRKATVRNTSVLTGQSKSTVARHLKRHGIAPRRAAKIQKLSKPAQKLVGILDATFDRTDSGLMKLSNLAMELWEPDQQRIIPKTTQASRIVKLKKLISEVTDTNIGYHIFTREHLCAVFRERRFRSLSRAVTWIDEQVRLDRYVSIQQPSRNPDQKSKYFWEDPIVQDVFTLIDMGYTGVFLPLEKLDALFRFERPLLDMSPVMIWIARAYESNLPGAMCERLQFLADDITDLSVRKATKIIARKMVELDKFMGDYPVCYDAFVTVDYALKVMDKAAEKAPESYARLAYIQHWFESIEDSYTENMLHRMLDLEKSGDWIAPDRETLAQYLPVPNEIEFQ
jgi:hypothetical protein